MNQKYCQRATYHLFMNQECGGILIFLANKIFRLFWSAWILGIYGKPTFLNFKDFQESPNPPKIPIPTPASAWGGPVA